MLTPRFRDRPGAAAAGELGAIGCLAVVVAIVALQGFLVGIGGPIVGIAVIMAIALFVIGHRRRSGRPRQPPPADPARAPGWPRAAFRRRRAAGADPDATRRDRGRHEPGPLGAPHAGPCAGSARRPSRSPSRSSAR